MLYSGRLWAAFVELNNCEAAKEPTTHYLQLWADYLKGSVNGYLVEIANLKALVVALDMTDFLVSHEISE